MDADLSHDVKYLPDFVHALDEEADVVIGARNIPGGGVLGWGLGRHLISKGGSLAIDTVHSNGYSFQIEMSQRRRADRARWASPFGLFMRRTGGARYVGLPLGRRHRVDRRWRIDSGSGGRIARRWLHRDCSVGGGLCDRRFGRR